MAGSGKKNRDSRRQWLIVLLLLVLLFVLLSLGKRGFIQQYRIRSQKKKLEQEISQLKEEKQGLQREQDLLQTSEYAEKIAREKFGMAKDNEDIYYVVPDTSEAKKKGADQKENEKDRRRQ